MSETDLRKSSKPLSKTKDNLVEITTKKPETPVQRDRRAELTLLSMMEQLPTRQLKRQFCQKNGISWAEYKYLCDKWSRVLDRFREEKKNQKESDNMANIFNLEEVREVME